MAIPVKPLEQDIIEAAATVPLLNGYAVNLVAGTKGAPHIAIDMMTVAECHGSRNSTRYIPYE
jgi:hypothetical protein